MEVCGLVFVMTDGGVIDVRKFIERDFVVESQALVSLFDMVAMIPIRGQLLYCLVPGFPGRALENSPSFAVGNKLQTSIYEAKPAAMPESRVKVSHLAQLRNNPAFVD